MQLDLNSGILLIGIVQGLFLSASLAMLKQGPKQANRFLILLLLCFVLALTVHFLNVTNIWQDYLYFYILSSSIVFLFGPSLYWYTQFLTQPNSRLSWLSALHLLPLVANLVMFIPLLQLPSEEIIKGIQAGQSGESGSMLLPVLKVIVVSSYTLISLKLLLQHRNRIKQEYSDLEKISLDWLRNLIIGFLTFEIFLVVMLIGNFDLSAIPGRLDSLLSLILIGLIFMTGFKGLQQPEIFRGATQSTPVAEDAELKKYQSSNLKESDRQAIQASLNQLFEEDKIYLDRFLDLKTLAKRSSVSTHQLSQYLNEQLQINFYDYVNQHRINHAKQLLSNSESSVLDIALESGFNNKATFNKAFKKYTQLTPSQYRQNNQ